MSTTTPRKPRVNGGSQVWGEPSAWEEVIFSGQHRILFQRGIHEAHLARDSLDSMITNRSTSVAANSQFSSPSAIRQILLRCSTANTACSSPRHVLSRLDLPLRSRNRLRRYARLVGRVAQFVPHFRLLLPSQNVSVSAPSGLTRFARPWRKSNPALQNSW